MANLSELVSRVEALEGPNREVDAEIASAVLGGKIIWKTQNYTMDQYPVRRFSSKNHASGFGCDPVELYTASLDAAMTLVATDDWREIKGPRTYLNIPTSAPNYWSASIESWNYERHSMGWGATPALALTAAALRARDEHPKGFAP